MPKFKVTFALLAAASLLGTDGCGGESEEKKAKRVAKDYVVALNEKDDERACELQTASSRKNPARGSCDLHSHGQAVPKSPKVENADLTGDRANALVTGSGASVTLNLVKEDGNWRVEEYQGQAP
jgi:hypothetical protein